VTIRRPARCHQAGPLFPQKGSDVPYRALLFGSVVFVLVSAFAGCGGDSDPIPSPTLPTDVTVESYPNSVVLGAPGFQHIQYTPGAGVVAATVTAPVSSSLLPAGRTSLVAEHRDARYPGLILACVSGKGDSTNVVTGINLGVITQSAAVLLDGSWRAVDTEAAWTSAASAGGSWIGWENCGAKPEGSPSPSSRLFPGVDRGYAEDVYDGNPSTSFNPLRRPVAPADVAKMISSEGLLTSEDPLRPLRLTLRAYTDGLANVIFVEIGEPVSAAPASARGFISLYVRGYQ
jgi:hypothetical protein